MWFKNLMIYQFDDLPELDEAILTHCLDEHRFKHCGPQQPNSIGWVTPMGELSDQLCHLSSSAFILTVRREERVLPAGVIREAVNEKILEIEQREARKVGGKQKMSLREDITFEMMPKAFTKSSRIQGLIMIEQKLIVIDTSSRNRAEEWLTLLRISLGGVKAKPIELKQSISDLFTNWLDGKIPLPSQVNPGDECELQSPDDSRCVVQCRRQDLESEEIKIHLKAGKKITRLAIDWNQSLSFVMNESAEIKRLKFNDTTVEKTGFDSSTGAAAEFDARFTLMSLELSRFLPSLLDTLGGTQDF